MSHNTVHSHVRSIYRKLGVSSRAHAAVLAGLVAITAPSGYVNTLGATIIGFVAGLLVCGSVDSSTACCV